MCLSCLGLLGFSYGLFVSVFWPSVFLPSPSNTNKDVIRSGLSDLHLPIAFIRLMYHVSRHPDLTCTKYLTRTAHLLAPFYTHHHPFQSSTVPPTFSRWRLFMARLSRRRRTFKALHHLIVLLRRPSCLFVTREEERSSTVADKAPEFVSATAQS
jgi:hypothetical protein